MQRHCTVPPASTRTPSAAAAPWPLAQEERSRTKRCAEVTAQKGNLLQHPRLWQKPRLAGPCFVVKMLRLCREAPPRVSVSE